MTDPADDLRTKFIAAKARLRIAALGAPAHKYDPNQPRVPRGHPDGGQWTDGGHGPATRGSRRPKRLRTAQNQQAQPDTAIPTWEMTELPDGGDPSVRRETATASDGTKLFSEVRHEDAPIDKREEFHLVRLKTGETFGIELKNGTQTIYDSEGRVLARTKWTDFGPQSAPVVQLAFAGVDDVIIAEKTIEAILLLGTYLYSKSGKQPLYAFKAEKYLPGDTIYASPVWAGRVSDEETRRACPKYDLAQAITDEAASEHNPKDYDSPAQYGTAVHSTAKAKIDKRKDPSFIAKKSILKGNAANAYYGQKGSIRIDILEDTGYNIICVYDIKTGISGLSGPRIEEIAHNVYKNYGSGHIVIVIEMRPSRFRR